MLSRGAASLAPLAFILLRHCTLLSEASLLTRHHCSHNCSHEASLLAQLLSRGIAALTTAQNMLALRTLARRTAARGFATSTNSRTWKVYLSGEIHSDWREVIGDGVSARNLPVTIDAPNTSHEDSDDCGAIILGDEEKRPNYDNKGAQAEPDPHADSH